MNMRIGRLNGASIQKTIPEQFTPFKSGLAGQPEQHAKKLESWIEENLSIICTYVGVQDGAVYFQVVQR